MSNRVVVIAPHPDDETLGCGGTLLKHVQSGDQVHWVIVTCMREEEGFSPDRIAARKEEIQNVSRLYPFHSYHELEFPTTKLDQIGIAALVQTMGAVFQQIHPHTVYVPFPGDVHTDHRYAYEAAIACTKWFRYPSVKRVLAYETLSETEFGLHPDAVPFQPNVFVDITEYLERKLQIMATFASELHDFPFPRSEQAIRSLAYVRGSTAGVKAAEAFMLLREIVG